MPVRLPSHADLPWFDVADDCLVIGGRKLTELAVVAGQTPFYVYDRGVMSCKVAALRQVLPPDMHLHYAVKANPLHEIVRHFVGLVDGLDVASAGELRVALDAGANPETVSFAGPGKTETELRLAAQSGITINIESIREIDFLGEIGRRSARPPRVAVRVNPDFELKSSGMKMGGGPKQFGVDAEQVPEVLAQIGDLPLDFRGFHIFSGSQNLRPESLVEAQQQTVDLALRLAKSAPAPIRVLNLGGGFGIPYFPGEKPLELAPVAANLSQLAARIRSALPEVELILEFGRYLVGEAGVYVCRVLDRKISRGHVFLVTDGGLHHHLAASGNFGQVLRKNYPVVVANRVRGESREVASVVGPLCTPLDLLADRMDLAAAKPGDLIAVFQSGAYGRSASPLGFLSHPPPAELVL